MSGGTAAGAGDFRHPLLQAECYDLSLVILHSPKRKGTTEINSFVPFAFFAPFVVKDQW